MKLLKALEQQELPKQWLDVLTVPVGTVRGVLLLTENELKSWLLKDGDVEFAKKLTNEQLEDLTSDHPFFRIVGKVFVPGDVKVFKFGETKKDKAVLLNISEDIINEFIDSDFTDLDDARKFLTKACAHSSYVATVNFRESMMVENMNRFLMQKYIDFHTPGQLPAFEFPKSATNGQPAKLVEKRIEVESQSVQRINKNAIEEALRNVLDESKPKRWTFTVKRNSQGLIESIEATTNN